MQIIPTLYIKDGKVAAYEPSNYDDLKYLDYDPYKLIEKLEKFEINRVHLIDLDASLPNDANNKGLIGSLSNTTVIDLEVGGGISNIDYLKSLQYAGVDYFVLGSVVIENFDFVREICEAEDVKNEDVIISADVKDGKLTYHGWTDQVPDMNLEELIYKCINQGFERFIVTEIMDKKEGPDIAFYQNLVKEFSGQEVIAAGNMYQWDHVLALEEIGVKGILLGGEIYEKDELLQKIADFNKHQLKEESK